MRAIKNISQLAGISAIVYALYSAWHTLPLRDAFLSSLATLTTVSGPTGHEEIVSLVARELPARLLSSPWLLLGAALILLPYMGEMMARAFVPQTHPVRRH